ncbi:MAG TPA: CocE/NonD family hydrolase, partial [Mycobacteriales bacterium]|nr:CocE/NonD family hydrolase [Mycobacteriales bacterium]
MSRDVRVERGVRIPLSAGVSLGADLFLPAGSGPVPAVVAILPYRRDVLGGAGCWTTLTRFAAAGYATVLVDPRGLGSSDGRPRAPFDPAEADDGVAAVEWAARQPWCSGPVGLWGFSYGAALALRTAGRQPAALRAVVSLMGFTDLERDFVHPGGVRGGIGPLGVWGLSTLVNQLLPPLHGHREPAEQRRWADRIEWDDPYLVDIARHPPGHPVWRSRAIDAGAVTVPTLSVGGWRDMFCDAAVRIHEQVRGPRALVMGPWMHSAPDDAADEPVDATALAVRWWDRWLGGRSTVDDPVTVYVQGAAPGWHALPSWSPADPVPVLSGGGGDAPADPTVGTLSGLWGIPNGGYGRPLDQHEDDARSVAVTGEPLAGPLLVLGRPAVSGVRGRVVVKLADVDPAGRSTLVTGTVTAAADGTVALDPTCYRFAAGHRLRVVVSDAAFPRVWPGPAAEVGVRDLVLRLPVAAGAGDPVPVERPVPGPDWATDAPRWEIVRDLLGSRVTVAVGDALRAELPGGHTIAQDTDIRASVRRDDPGSADLRATTTAEVRLATGEQVQVRAELILAGPLAAATGAVSVDGSTLVVRSWDLSEPQPGQPGSEQEQGSPGPAPHGQRPHPFRRRGRGPGHRGQRRRAEQRPADALQHPSQ